MAVITFMSDFGEEDHYVAAVKAVIISRNPEITIVDISHRIKPGDIGHAAYLLRSVFQDFPEGTVHLSGVDSIVKGNNRLLALKLESHYFVGADNGIFSLISEQKPDVIIDVNYSNPIQSTFPTKDILAIAAAKLSKGQNITEMGQPVERITELFARKLKVTKREIAGNVIRVDRYGNLITNILKKEFEIIYKMNKNPIFEITIGRETVTQISQSYPDVDSGDCFAFFNSNGLLEIGLNKGNASELLGLKLDTPITITFHI
ncbi:MAG: S-adenosylmethionine hydrolase [Cyclobacteriaceae bacterium]|jgi:S-adenosylmethionine hydrolase